MCSERAGDYSLPRRNNASSTIEGKGDTITYYIRKFEKRKLWDRGFCRNSSLQAAWDTSIARTTGLMCINVRGNSRFIEHLTPYHLSQNINTVRIEYWGRSGPYIPAQGGWYIWTSVPKSCWFALPMYICPISLRYLLVVFGLGGGLN